MGNQYLTIGGMDKVKMRELIGNERYVELCFEGKRYWDHRRWKTAATELNNKKGMGAVITKTNNTFSYEYLPVDPQNMVFSEKMYFKIHVFGSRWPAAKGMDGWMGDNAEIAHFVGDGPEGPFKYVRTVLKTSDFPDPNRMWAPHNSRISFVDGKYVLRYIVQTRRDEVVMAVGMMIADNIDGPWRFVGIMMDW